MPHPPRSLVGRDSENMRAVGVTARPPVGTAAAALAWVEVGCPVPKRGQVRVRVMAAGVNRDDLHAMEGTVFGGIPVTSRPTTDAPLVPGMELAGVVDAIGDGVEGLQVGQRVFGVVYMQKLGGLAPFCCTNATLLRPLPERWSYVEGAAIGFSGSVAAMAVQSGGVVAGKRCLVVGASGNIGGLIVQVLQAAGAAEVVGICGGPNVAHVEGLGADRVVDYTKGPWVDALKQDEGSFDRVFDCVGGTDTESAARRLLNPTGHFVTLCGPMAHLGGVLAPWHRILRSLAYIGWRVLVSRLRGPRYTFVSGSAPDWSALERLVLDRDVRPVVERTCPLAPDAVADAMTRLMGRHRCGKQVVLIGTTDEPTPSPVPSLHHTVLFGHQ